MSDDNFEWDPMYDRICSWPCEFCGEEYPDDWDDE